MGRHTVIQKSSLNLTAPNYSALVSSIAELQGAESSFYNSRKDELNQYLGLGGLSSSKVESDYDALLGPEPWTYLQQLSSSGNSYGSGTGAGVYIKLPASLAARISGTITDRYNHGEYLDYASGGIREVDLLYTNIEFFRNGSTATTEIDDEFDNPTTITYRTGFGHIPSAYQSNNQLTGRVAQTLYVAGTSYNSIVGGKYSAYLGQLNAYNSYVGGGSSNTYTGGTPDRPYEGYTPPANSFGYNRPSTLTTNIVEESRGYS